MTPPNATPPASEHREFNRLDIEQVASSFARIAKVCHNTARVYITRFLQYRLSDAS